MAYGLFAGAGGHRALFLWAALLALALLFPDPVLAASPDAVVESDEPAYLRNAPWGGILGSVSPGGALTVLEADCDAASEAWLRVSSSSGRGWIFADLVEFQNGFAAEVVIGPLRTRDAPWGMPQDLIALGGWVRVTGVACDDDGAAWYRLRSGNWTFAGYLRAESGPAPTAMDGVAWATIQDLDGVLLRASPWGALVGSVSGGRSVVVLNSQLDESGDWWHEVVYGRKRGWVHGNHLELGPLESGQGRSLVARLQGGSYAILYAFEGEQLARLMTARSGGPWDPTPRGDFRVLEHLGTIHTTIFRWRIGHEWYLPHFIQFQGHYGIHGPMIDDRTNRALMVETAGCLMPSAADAAWLYNWLQPGDRITIR